MKPMIKSVLRVGLTALPLISGLALADGIPGYVTDSQGVIVRNSYGECWHTDRWRPELAVVGCDGMVAVVEPPPPPPPPPVYIPPKRCEEHMTLSDEEARFAFNKSGLSAPSRARLNDLVDRVRRFDTVDRVVVTGHADRIGSDSYNMRLSRRRAQTVKDYLVDQRMADPNVIEVDARGESEPVVECHQKSRKRLIACLAPNRRVVVDVEGSGNSCGR
ncbi:hypothetical protein TI04_07505 [Achromatium sp. WMS2]|nr:hypothetical protein TI04_07505 [Achromatium sp. WMS2]